MNAFLIALSVVDEGKKGGERVRNGRGVEVVLKDLEHLKSLPEVLGVGVLKQVADRAILGRAKLALPGLAREFRVLVTRRESSRAVEKPGDRSQ